MTLNTPDMEAKLFPRRAGRCLTRFDSHEMMLEALIKSTVQEEWLVEGVQCTTEIQEWNMAPGGQIHPEISCLLVYRKSVFPRSFPLPPKIH